MTACEARIVRVLRTLGYPGLDDLLLGSDSSSPSFSRESLMQKPDELARMVSWIEDRKVRGCAIDDRAPLRVAGPGWEDAFFAYLSKIECPYDFTAGEKGDARTRLLRGVSWLMTKAVACEFEDRGTEYNAAARELLAQAPSSYSTEGLRSPTPIAEANTGSSAMNVVAGAGWDKTTWSPGFLSALAAACRALDVNSEALPSPFPPAPPTASDSATPVPSNEGGGNPADLMSGSDARVVQELEALLAAAQKRVLVRDMEEAAAGGRGAGDKDVDSEEAKATGDDGVVGYHDELVGLAAGVCTGDEACDRVGTVLRMLFLLDLRGLQDEVNAILAVAQNVEAA